MDDRGGVSVNSASGARSKSQQRFCAQEEFGARFIRLWQAYVKSDEKEESAPLAGEG